MSNLSQFTKIIQAKYSAKLPIHSLNVSYIFGKRYVILLLHLGNNGHRPSRATRIRVFFGRKFSPCKTFALVVAILVSLDPHRRILCDHRHHSTDLVGHIESIRKKSNVVNAFDCLIKGVLSHFYGLIKLLLVDEHTPDGYLMDFNTENWRIHRKLNSEVSSTDSVITAIMGDAQVELDAGARFNYTRRHAHMGMCSSKDAEGRNKMDVLHFRWIDLNG